MIRRVLNAQRALGIQPDPVQTLDPFHGPPSDMVRKGISCLSEPCSPSS